MHLNPSTARRTGARVLLIVVLAVAGAWLGLRLGGTVHQDVGPLQTTMRVTPTWGGGTVLDIPPLGQLELATHQGPLGLRASLQGVDVEQARTLLQDPGKLDRLKAVAERDLRAGVERAAVRALVAGILGAVLLTGIALRRVRSALAGGATAVVAMAACAAVAVGSRNPNALAEPRYTGLLTSAPSVVGNAQSIVTDFSRYGDELGRIVQNVSGIYAVTSNLPLLPADDDLVRVLHVSDLHLAPQAWDVIRTVAAQYHVDVIVDSGDITDHGTTPENRYLQPIRSLGKPYVWVRGNHDSTATEAAMRKIPNAVVLEGHVRKVAGLTFLGGGDPSFTPDKRVNTDDDAEQVAARANDLAGTALAAGGVDVMVYHDPAPKETFDGTARMALFGHLHYRKVTRGAEGTWEMVQGSTGGSGLRALEPKTPANIELSVLFVDPGSGDLVAYDDITLGGLGLASAQINRHVVDQDQGTTEMVSPEPRQQPTVLPTPTVSPSEPARR
jgi:predicted phosphodiesterase